MKKPYTWLLIAAILIGAVCLARCTARGLSPSPTLSISETAAPEPSLTPSPTLTPTLTKTPRPTATATHVPLPTLPPAEALEKVQELLDTNGGCAFPCWWGITPGETTYIEVLDTLQPIAWRISRLKNHPVYRDKITREFYFAVDDQPTLMNSQMVVFVLEKTTLEIDWLYTSHPYPLGDILLDYGSPEEIWLYATGIPGTGPVVYRIELFYPDKHIMTSIGNYAEMVHENGEDYARVCKDSLIGETGGVLVWSLDSQMEFKDFFREHEETDKYLPIEDVIDMSPQEFTNLILENNGSNCLELPLSKWEK